MNNLKLLEISDRELLYILSDVADDNGWASTRTIAGQIGLTHARPNQCVGARMAALRRFGALEKRVKKDQSEWRMTDRGYGLMTGELKMAQERILDGLDADQMLVVTRWLTNRWRQSDTTTSHLVRREWTYGTSRRSGVTL